MTGNFSTALKKEGKIEWIYSLRFLAILLIMVVHFVDLINEDLFVYWDEGPSSIFLGGMTGKLAVAFFSVLLGYFATRKFQNKTDFGKYTLTRYFMFSSSIFIVEGLFIIAAFTSLAVFNTDIVFEGFGLPSGLSLGLLHEYFISLLVDSFLFGGEVITTYWCFLDFFIGSLLCALLAIFVSTNERLKEPVKISLYVLTIAILYLTGAVWTSVCVIGGLFFHIQKMHLKLLDNRVFCLLILLLIPFFIQQPENNETYILQAIASVILLITCFRFEVIQRVLSAKWLVKLGEISFPLFLVHAPLNALVILPLNIFLSGLFGWEIAFALCFAASLGISIAASLALKRFSDFIMKKFVQVFV